MEERVLQVIDEATTKLENRKLIEVLASALRGSVSQKSLRTSEVAQSLGVPQVRLNALLQGDSHDFQLEALVNMALKLGLQIRLEVDNARSADALGSSLLLERMCDALIHRDTVAFMDDVQRFWAKGWEIEDVEDPKDSDPLVYALKACFLERMAEIWSAPPKSHDSTPPAWCKNVPAVRENFSVIADEYREFYEGDMVSPIFAKRNIFAPRDFMFTA